LLLLLAAAAAGVHAVPLPWATVVDWRHSGMVNLAVYNNGAKTPSAVPATADAIGAALAIAAGKGPPPQIDIQQFEECASRSESCKGLPRPNVECLMEYARSDGICPPGAGCTCASPARLGSFKVIARNNEAALEVAVATGPVVVAVEADTPVWQHYKSGVMGSSQCGTLVDHAMLVVGFGTDSGGDDYWILKNSWGPSWGEQGYIRLLRGNSTHSPGECGIAEQAVLPLGGGFSTPTVLSPRPEQRGLWIS
jgi:hypothetical protein